VELVARDALDASSSQLQQAVSLHLLAALVTVGAQASQTLSGGSLQASEIILCGMPGAPMSRFLWRPS
jgi:hypothetical protein